MLNLELKPFQAGHLDFFEPAKGYEGQAEVYSDFLERLGLLCQAASHVIDGKVIFISSSERITATTWEVMIIPSVHLPRYIKSAVKDIRIWLDIFKEKDGTKRIQTWGYPTDLSKRWLTYLGFEYESTMPYYDEEGDKEVWRILV